MKRTFKTTAAAAAGALMTAGALAFAAPAAATPQPGDNAAQAVDELRAGGNRVIIDSNSDRPLSESTIVSVVPGPTIQDSEAINDPYQTNQQNQRVSDGQVYYVTVQ